MIRAHKIRLFPNEDQSVYLRKACGVARFAYNYALSEWKAQYEAGLKPNEGMLRKHLNAVKREKFPWMLEVTKCAPEQAIRNLGTAFGDFFKAVKQGKKTGYPKFKKKGQRDSFYIDNEKGSIAGKLFNVPKMKTPIRMSEELRFEGKILSYTVSKDVDRWYVSIAVDSTCEELPKTGKTVGVDLGIKALATMSDGTTVENPNILKKALNKLARKQRELSRKQKGSNNREKARIKVAKVHRKVRLTRLDVLHQLTTRLVRDYDTIVIEDLNVKGMLKNHKLARSISDCGFGMFRSLLQSKCKMYGKELVVADRFFPSSKTCSKCGHKKEELKLSERTFVCENCNFEIDRDLNAAINLEKWPSCWRHQSVDSVSDPPKVGQRKVKQKLETTVEPSDRLLEAVSNR
jgi:putative transposase